MVKADAPAVPCTSSMLGGCNMCPAVQEPCTLPGTRSMLRAATCPAPPWSPPAACPGGRAAGCPHRLPAAQHQLPHPTLPAPITTASYSRCSRFAAPAWASRAPGSPGDRCQPHSQREGQPVPSLAQSPAAIAPQCPAMAALCPAAWTLLSQQSFSQGFWARGGARGARAGDALAQGWTLRPRACGEAGQDRDTSQVLSPSTACSRALTPAKLCQGLAGVPETSPSAEKATGLEPAWCSVGCQVLPSLYPRKALGRQVQA